MGLATIKKGDIVALVGFTGIRLSDQAVTAATKTELSLTKKDGTVMVFDRKTGVQKDMAEGKEKYANKIMDPEEAPENKVRSKKSKIDAAAKEAAKAARAAEKAPKKKAPVVEVDEDEEDEEEEEEVPAPKKKKAAAAAPAPAKTKTKKKPVVEEDDEDEYEEL